MAIQATACSRSLVPGRQAASIKSLNTAIVGAHYAICRRAEITYAVLMTYCDPYQCQHSDYGKGEMLFIEAGMFFLPLSGSISDH